MLPVYILLFAMNSFLQALKHPMHTLWIGIYRQGFGIAFFCAVFVLVLEWGTWGVWFGIAASVASGFLLALWITWSVAPPGDWWTRQTKACGLNLSHPSMPAGRA